MTIGREISRKLSLRELGFDKGRILETVMGNRNEQHFLARFIGVANGVKPYKIKEGDRAGEVAFGLMGEFEGSDSDGVTANGAVLYLPGYVSDMITSILQSSEDISGVRIAFDVYARFDEKAATSYVFVVNDLLNTQQAGVEEVKAELKALPMPAKTPALTAPKK